MKSVVFTKPREYEIVDVPIPDVGSNDVLIKMKALGICGSELNVFKGANPVAVFPVVPAHENAGVVEKVGDLVRGINVGDHVVTDAANACGKCPECKKGEKNHCKGLRIRGANIDGGMQEYYAAPQEDVYVISKDISWLDAAMIEPFTIGSQAVCRGRVSSEDIVYIFGSGTIATTIIQLCKLAEATVICAGRNAVTLARAKEHGADFVIDTNNDDLVEKLSEITNGEGVSVAIDTACYEGSLASLFQPGIVRSGGRIVTIGFCPIPEISQSMVMQRELELIGSRLSCGQFEFIAKAMAEKKLITKDLITHVFKFDEIEKVFHYFENPDPSVKKMVVTFE